MRCGVGVAASKYNETQLNFEKEQVCFFFFVCLQDSYLLLGSFSFFSNFVHL